MALRNPAALGRGDQSFVPRTAVLPFPPLSLLPIFAFVAVVLDNVPFPLAMRAVTDDCT
jgi:hypothetical protein